MDATADYHDWELLQVDSDEDYDKSFPDVDSGGIIQTNYFSLDAQKPDMEAVSDEKSTTSDNPSWIDPGLGDNDPVRCLHKESRESWSDSSSARSEDLKSTFSDRRNDIVFSEKEENTVDLGGIEEIARETFNFDSSGIEQGSAHVKVIEEEKESLQHPEPEVISKEESETEKEKGGDVVKKIMVWWKMPMEFLKYCVLRMSPFWTISVAAAAMGFVILGRRLYKMKKKARGLEIKVTVDDKKVSQVMSQADRLNEAFSVVKRFPVIRPALPAVNSTTRWPAMSLR